MATCNGFLYAVGGHDAPASNPTSSRFDCVERCGFIVGIKFEGLFLVVQVNDTLIADGRINLLTYYNLDRLVKENCHIYV